MTELKDGEGIIRQMGFEKLKNTESSPILPQSIFWKESFLSKIILESQRFALSYLFLIVLEMVGMQDL